MLASRWRELNGLFGSIVSIAQYAILYNSSVPPSRFDAAKILPYSHLRIALFPQISSSPGTAASLLFPPTDFTPFSVGDQLYMQWINFYTAPLTYLFIQANLIIELNNTTPTGPHFDFSTAVLSTPVTTAPAGGFPGYPPDP